MKTINYHGFECTVSKKTLSLLNKWDEEIERDRRAREIEEENEAWLRDPKNRNSEIYSDVYKDVYGVRPRW